MLRGPTHFPSILAVMVAFGTAFLFFLELRIADEFKDFEEDARYRPYRPVQRGLVTLRELAIVGVIGGMIQLLLALLLDVTLLLLLAIVWIYLILMSREFFVGHWLRARPIPYLISHMVILPLVDLYATACDWWGQEDAQHLWLIPFLMASYFNGVVIEIGRKFRAPGDEEVGVNTYTVLWGRRTAALVWLGAMLGSAACATIAAGLIGFAGLVSGLLGMGVLMAGLTAWAFLHTPNRSRAKRIELVSGLWTILLYVSVGAVPLAWRYLSSGSSPPIL
jgi:4-hydroxybenzoate polyprenyltransferase